MDVRLVRICPQGYNIISCSYPECKNALFHVQVPEETAPEMVDSMSNFIETIGWDLDNKLCPHHSSINKENLNEQ
jgi:hypothetical protein